MDRQLNLSLQREQARLKKYKKNFYVLDCETTQLKKPEPICIAACLYENGKPGLEYKRFFMPEKDIKTEAE